MAYQYVASALGECIFDESPRDGRECIPLESQHDFVDGIDVFDADKFLVQTAVEIGQVIGVKSHEMQGCRVQIFYMQWIFDGRGTEFIGGAV